MSETSKYQTIDLTLERSLQRAIGLGENLTEEQKQDILKERARMLAQPISESESQSGDMLRVLAFHLGNEIYAFPAASVFNVAKSISLTPVPCVPNFVAGITNMRGHIRSVVRLAEFLNIPADRSEANAQPDDNEYVVTAQYEDMEVAFMVTALDEVRDIPIHNIKPRPTSGNSVASQYIAGVVPGGLIILDLAAIFTDHRFIINDEIA